MGVQPSGKNWWSAIKEHGMEIILKRKLSKMMLVILNQKWELPNTNVYLPHAKQKKSLKPNMSPISWPSWYQIIQY